MLKSIRILIVVATSYDFEIWQMDIKTTFLNGNLLEDAYMTEPEGFIHLLSYGKVCKHQRSIYGLKQASQSWNFILMQQLKN